MINQQLHQQQQQQQQQQLSKTFKKSISFQ